MGTSKSLSLYFKLKKFEEVVILLKETSNGGSQLTWRLKPVDSWTHFGSVDSVQ